METVIRILKTLTGLSFLAILSVVPFCLCMEQIGNEWLQQQWAKGINVKHEGMEIVLLYWFGLYSIPFLIWTVSIFRKPKVKKFLDLAVIILVAVLPALFLNYIFYRAFYHYHQ